MNRVIACIIAVAAILGIVITAYVAWHAAAACAGTGPGAGFCVVSTLAAGILIIAVLFAAFIQNLNFCLYGRR